MNLNQKFKLIVLVVVIVAGILFISDMKKGNVKDAETIEEKEIIVCPDMAYLQWGEECINHLNERYPGKLSADGLSQEMPELTEETSHDRFKQLCYKYGLNPSAIWEVENKYNLREGIVLAIIIAETSGGKNGYGKEGCWNYGNVGNNDRGDRYCFTSESEGLNKIGKTLNNSLLGTTQTLGCLSKAGSCTWWEDKGHIYASSDGNWERTITNVLNAIYEDELGEIQPERFNVRRTFTIYQ